VKNVKNVERNVKNMKMKTVGAGLAPARVTESLPE